MQAEAALISALLLCSSQTSLAVTDRMLARHIFLPTTTDMLPFTALADQKTSFPLVACQHSKDSTSLALLPLTTPTQEVCKDYLNHSAEMLKHLQAPAVLT